MTRRIPLDELGKLKQLEDEERERLVNKIMRGLDVDPDLMEELDRRRELIDEAQMKALPLPMQKVRRAIREAWKEREESADDERS